MNNFNHWLDTLTWLDVFLIWIAEMMLVISALGVTDVIVSWMGEK